MAININPNNTILIVGGIGALIMGQIAYKGGWNIIPTIGGLISLGAGIADATGIFPTVSKANYGYAGSYAVTANNLPYDPNNYYLPPRDSSILA